MILKLGSKGQEVKELQEFLGIKADGDFGLKTELAVKKYQHDNGLIIDGIVGSNTLNHMGILMDTDLSTVKKIEYKGLEIEPYHLPKGEYKEGPTKKEYLFLHHTAGWHNPYKVIDSWGRDSRGSIATEFVVGGQSIKDETEYDGKVLQAFPEGGYGWHLGKNGSQHMHIHSVGIELCNFGYIKDKKTYSGTTVNPTQRIQLENEFRGYSCWHKYSENQLKATKDLILYIAERDNIDVRAGLISEIKKNGIKAFEFNEDAYYGKVKGMWTHTNTRRDKTDLSPQPDLIDMLLSI